MQIGGNPHGGNNPYAMHGSPAAESIPLSLSDNQHTILNNDNFLQQKKHIPQATGSPHEPKPLLLLDGGLGTTLEDEYHVTFSSTFSPTWSSHLLISSPETLHKSHRSFANAGADIILTATYQASVEGFIRTPRHHQPLLTEDGDADDIRTISQPDAPTHYTQADAIHLLRSAIPLARSSFPTSRINPGLTALSLGPYGATTIPSTEYSGAYPAAMRSISALTQWHAERLSIFPSDEETWRGVDLVAFETLPRVAEVEAVRRVMAELGSGVARKPFWLCCVFASVDERLADGSGVSEVVRAMLAPTSSPPSTMRSKDVLEDAPFSLSVPMGIGINCTKLSKLRRLIRSFEDAAAALPGNIRLPHLVVYPDGAGESTYYNTETQTWVTRTPSQRDQGDSDTEDSSNHHDDKWEWSEEIFEIVQEVQKRDKWTGIIVGGCCKTKPRDIARLRKRIDGHQK